VDGSVPAPRHFWRRTGALIVDFLIASALVTLVLFPFVGNGDRIRLTGNGFVLSSCWSVDQISQELADLIAPALPQAVKVCEIRPFGIRQGLTADLTYDLVEDTTGAVTSRSYKTLTVPIDANGQPIVPVTPGSLLEPLLMLLGSIWFLGRWNGQTPGKRLLGLRVAGSESPGRWSAREVRRVGPFVLFGATTLALELSGPAVTASLMAHLGLYLGVVALLGLWFLWYYLVPLVRWRGAMRYDRATGLQVVRA
jgi:hypothetical protein